VVVLDPDLVSMTNVLQGLKPDGSLLINSAKESCDLQHVKWNKVATVDATSIAIKHGLGSEDSPIVNTAIIGAFSKICPQVPLESVIESIMKASPGDKQANAEAAKEAYAAVKGVW
jgi:2-oxoacid:acceptor oxidoreductase gamma subunit (pyruvate/2-ketoisovalerate family)